MIAARLRLSKDLSSDSSYLSSAWGLHTLKGNEAEIVATLSQIEHPIVLNINDIGAMQECFRSNPKLFALLLDVVELASVTNNVQVLRKLLLEDLASTTLMVENLKGGGVLKVLYDPQPPDEEMPLSEVLLARAIAIGDVSIGDDFPLFLQSMDESIYTEYVSFSTLTTMAGMLKPGSNWYDVIVNLPLLKDQRQHILYIQALPPATRNNINNYVDGGFTYLNNSLRFLKAPPRLRWPDQDTRRIQNAILSAPLIDRPFVLSRVVRRNNFLPPVGEVFFSTGFFSASMAWDVSLRGVKDTRSSMYLIMVVVPARFPCLYVQGKGREYEMLLPTDIHFSVDSYDPTTRTYCLSVIG
jgi:hypothetical protein